MNKRNLSLAGWLSVVTAVLYIPLAALSFISGTLEVRSAGVMYFEALLNSAYCAVFVFVLLSFKRLLNEFFLFHDVDVYISILIWVNVALTLIVLVALPFPQAQLAFGAVSLLLMIPMGIIFTVFGIKLLNMKGDLFGYLKPLSYLTIATGAFFATVILFPLGAFSGAVSDIFLALIFFKAASQPRSEGNFNATVA